MPLMDVTIAIPTRIMKTMMTMLTFQSNFSRSRLRLPHAASAVSPNWKVV